MAGAGYKLFNTGDVLTAAQVNTYLQEQAVMRFANATARTTALSGVLAEGMMSYLDDTNSVEVYNGSAWVSVSSDQTPLTTKGDLFTYSTTDARLPVGNNGETLVADSSASVGLRYQEPKAGNPVINSSFQVWQRGTSVSVAASTPGYTADRWYFVNGANQASTISRQTTSDTTNLPNIQYCARVQRNSGQTGTGTISLSQPFESVNSIPFAGKTVTLSFYARKGADYSATSSVLTVYLATGTGTDQNQQGAGYTGQVLAVNSTATLTTTWQRFTYSATLGTTATELQPIFTFTPVGTASTNDYFEITGIQIEVGSVATPFKTQGVTLAGELGACQRYYYRITEFQIAGGTQSAAENKVFFALNSFNGVQMRTTPTAAFESTPYVTNGASNLRTVTAVAVASKAMIGFTYDSTRLTDSYSYMINAADAGRAVSLSAEL